MTGVVQLKIGTLLFIFNSCRYLYGFLLRGKTRIILMRFIFFLICVIVKSKNFIFTNKVGIFKYRGREYKNAFRSDMRLFITVFFHTCIHFIYTLTSVHERLCLHAENLMR